MYMKDGIDFTQSLPCLHNNIVLNTVIYTLIVWCIIIQQL